MGEYPTLTLSALRNLDPCEDRIDFIAPKWPDDKALNAIEARALGATLDDIVWAASALAKDNPNIDRRLRLWIADCAAHVLQIYEKTERSDAPRKAIIAGRQYARGQIGAAAWAAARDAAWAAAWDAAGAVAKAAARAAAGDAGWDAAWAAARAAAGDAEEEWQFDRLILWFTDEPEDWPLPERKESEAA